MKKFYEPPLSGVEVCPGTFPCVITEIERVGKSEFLDIKCERRFQIPDNKTNMCNSRNHKTSPGAALIVHNAWTEADAFCVAALPARNAIGADRRRRVAPLARSVGAGA